MTWKKRPYIFGIYCSEKQYTNRINFQLEDTSTQDATRLHVLRDSTVKARQLIIFVVFRLFTVCGVW